MENMFSNDSRQFKFDVLVALCRSASKGEVDEDEIQAYAHNLVSLSSPRVRCCVYKEREVFLLQDILLFFPVIKFNNKFLIDA